MDTVFLVVIALTLAITSGASLDNTDTRKAEDAGSQDQEEANQLRRIRTNDNRARYIEKQAKKRGKRNLLTDLIQLHMYWDEEAMPTLPVDATYSQFIKVAEEIIEQLKADRELVTGAERETADVIISAVEGLISMDKAELIAFAELRPEEEEDRPPPLLTPAPAEVSLWNVLAAMAEADTDGDTHVSYEELIQWAGMGCCRKSDCSDYYGFKATTRSGHTCLPWSDDRRALIERDLGEQMEPGANYCRTLSGYPYPWCFTHAIAEESRWESRLERCDIPKC